MPATSAFAALEQRLGRAIGARLGNAQAVIAGAGGNVAGILSRRPIDVAVASAGLRSREVVFTCLAADLAAAGANPQRGTALTAYHGDQTATPAGSFTVYARTDVHETGQVTLELEAA